VSARAAGWLLFGALALTVPLPMVGPFDAFVPAARYLLLFGAALAVALVEGASGPVPLLVALFGGHAVVSLAAAGLAAWLAARGLSGLDPSRRRALVLAVCAALLLAALATHPYRTTFGRAPTANLLGILS
jgi:hypothetical protein